MARADSEASSIAAQSNGSTWRLPPVIAHQRFKPTYLAIWMPYILAYQIVNRYPLFEPTTLPFSQLDRVIPFVPQLLPVYVGYLVYYFWTVARMENDREVNRAFYGTHLQLFLSLPVFVFFPVTMPRDLFYIGQTYNWADVFWRWFDAPNNCIPSLHAANIMLLMQLNWHLPRRWFSVATGAAIITSTVFVKQHYVVDVVAGALVYLAARGFLARLEITGVDVTGWGLWRRSALRVPESG